MKKLEHSLLVIFELVVVVTDTDDEEKYVEGLQVGNPQTSFGVLKENNYKCEQKSKKKRL